MHFGLFIVIIALLLSVMTARAAKPTVIKDSEATQYVGKEVEVRGRVVPRQASSWERDRFIGALFRRSWREGYGVI